MVNCEDVKEFLNKDVLISIKESKEFPATVTRVDFNSITFKGERYGTQIELISNISSIRAFLPREVRQ